MKYREWQKIYEKGENLAKNRDVFQDFLGKFGVIRGIEFDLFPVSLPPFN